ncbi:ABC transporter permease [Spirilliplanes yamanashiensis]|uniref:ABC transporter permease n=1 Tax=Spirilliplanes yamanashiensis TaxID=42233 RepID=A0A8J3Y9V5_9ACTN|nr:ABC-2 family transporter protein [Spirilliplanes yamanashiensis]GIJ03880.1 ABC transporter permease [Spirilliplanes yamanashiensis]
MLRTIRLYLRLLGTHLRASLEYEADFWLMALGAAMTQVAGFVFIAAVFLRVPDINGWTFWTVALLFGMVGFSEGVINLFFEGMWWLADLKHNGELDYLLVRPYPVALQALSSQVGLNGLGNLLTGGALIVAGLVNTDIDWSPATAVVAVLLFLGAMAARVGIMLACNATTFWLEGPTSMFAFAVHQVGDLARYPLAIYPVVLKGLLGVVLPFAFVSFFPVSWLTGEGGTGWLGLLTPLVGVYCVVLAAWVFRRGLTRYESAGN